jgi:hypothetical protein
MPFSANSQTKSPTFKSAGTPEQTNLTVKSVAGTWIVENGIGENVGGSTVKEEAIKQACEIAKGQNASEIAVLREDGAHEKTIDI